MVLSYLLFHFTCKCESDTYICAHSAIQISQSKFTILISTLSYRLTSNVYWKTLNKRVRNVASLSGVRAIYLYVCIYVCFYNDKSFIYDATLSEQRTVARQMHVLSISHDHDPHRHHRHHNPDQKPSGNKPISVQESKSDARMNEIPRIYCNASKKNEHKL